MKNVGVLIHGTDHTEDSENERPWAPCSKASPNCGFLSDRMSASLVYEGKTVSFSSDGGVVLNPEYTRLLCAYGGDGGTRGKACSPPGVSDTCLPGCKSNEWDPDYCDAQTASLSDYWCGGRPWRKDDVAKFLVRDRYNSARNEIVVDGFHWNENLPHAIDAFLTSGDSRTARVHAMFLSAYGLTEEQVPLLMLSKEAHNPFRLATPRPDAVSGAAPSIGASNVFKTVHTGDLSELGFGRT